MSHPPSHTSLSITALNKAKALWRKSVERKITPKQRLLLHLKHKMQLKWCCTALSHVKTVFLHVKVSLLLPNQSSTEMKSHSGGDRSHQHISPRDGVGNLWLTLLKEGACQHGRRIGNKSLIQSEFEGNTRAYAQSTMLTICRLLFLRRLVSQTRFISLHTNAFLFYTWWLWWMG